MTRIPGNFGRRLPNWAVKIGRRETRTLLTRGNRTVSVPSVTFSESEGTGNGGGEAIKNRTIAAPPSKKIFSPVDFGSADPEVPLRGLFFCLCCILVHAAVKRGKRGRETGTVKARGDKHYRPDARKNTTASETLHDAATPGRNFKLIANIYGYWKKKWQKARWTSTEGS